MASFNFSSFTVILLTIIYTTGCKLINGLPRFSRSTLGLNKSIRIIRCFRSFGVIVFYISQLFCTFPNRVDHSMYKLLLCYCCDMEETA